MCGGGCGVMAVDQWDPHDSSNESGGWLSCERSGAGWWSLMWLSGARALLSILQLDVTLTQGPVWV